MCLEGPAAVLLAALASVFPGGLGIQAPSSPSPDRTLQSRGVRVTVTLTAPDRSRLHSAAVVMARDSDGAAGEASPDDIAIQPDESFVFTNVEPGVYRIRARASTASGAAPLLALYRIIVGTRDLDITLTLLPGASISGRLDADPVNAEKPAALAGVQIQTPFADGSGAGETASGDVVRGGSFTIRGVMPGRHLVTIAGLPYPWVLQRVTYRGQDVTDAGLDTDSGQSIDDVRVTITDVATDLSGTVRDAEGRTVPGAVVLIIPPAPQFRTAVSRRFGKTTAGEDGRYRYRGLPPGEYRVVASTIDSADLYRPEILQRFNDAGAPLSLDARAALVMDLRLTPSITPQQASAR